MNTSVDEVAVTTPARRAIAAEPVGIDWTPNLPIFAKGEFLKAVGDEYGWLGGFDHSGTQRCILPYTIVHKAGLRLVRFRVETIPCGPGLDAAEEKSFLNSVVEHFREAGADVIIPASNNTLFRTYPDGAKAAPYGSYVIDLRQPEEMLWKNIERKTRESITKARKDGVSVREGIEFLDPAYDLIRETFRRSKLAFMERDAFRELVIALGEHGKLMMAEYQGVAQNYSLYAWSAPCAYAIYSGNTHRQHKGAYKLVQWEAIRFFRNLGILKFDFYGARINPRKDSKQESINLTKERFGATLARGYMWKHPLRPSRASNSRAPSRRPRAS